MAVDLQSCHAARVSSGETERERFTPATFAAAWFEEYSTLGSYF